MFFTKYTKHNGVISAKIAIPIIGIGEHNALCSLSPETGLIHTALCPLCKNLVILVVKFKTWINTNML